MDQNTDTFDPYHRWLGISPKDQPPNHYRLLAIDLFESDPEVIRDGAERQMTHVRKYQLGKHTAVSQKILNEIAAARVCLLDSAKKAAYDATLRAKIAPTVQMPPSPAPDLLSVEIQAQPLPSTRPFPRRNAKAVRGIGRAGDRAMAAVQRRIRMAVAIIACASATVIVLSLGWTLVSKGKKATEMDSAKVVGDSIRDDVRAAAKVNSSQSGVERTTSPPVVSPPPAIASPPVVAPPFAVAPFDAQKAKKHQETWVKHLGMPVEQTNSIGMKLVLIPPGEFEMGSTKEFVEDELRLHGRDRLYRNPCLPGEAPRHRVRITKPYWLGVTEVTQEEYQRVMGSNPSKFRGDPKRPVEQVTWDQAVEFCRRLSESPGEKGAKRRYGLPTEAQWEYACRAGSAGRWYFSERSSSVPTASEERLLGEYGWFNANAGGQTRPVGQKRANVFGLSDMYGNVWEFCRDWYDKDYYAKSPTDDPMGPLVGSARVVRGGSWSNPAERCRSATRSSNEPRGRGRNAGFRVSLVPADK
ncbi:MAG: formylglycine-generating enzyme family protein [Thermoguttaceae bacterium]